MPKKTEGSFDKDSAGVKYQHPERTCKECAKYPCFRGQEERFFDYAKYGCIHYKDK